MATAKGLSFPKDKLYLYDYILSKDSNMSRYVLKLIEADYFKNSTTVDIHLITQSIDSIQKELFKMKKLLN